MVSAVSAEASAHGHLHLDPSLEIAPEVPVKARCATCCPIGSILKKVFCCCASNCCNTTNNYPDTRAVYCKSDGTCVPFEPSKSENPKEDYRKTADRVKTLIESEKQKRGSVIRQETGVDLEGKLARGEPLRVHELRRLQSI